MLRSAGQGVGVLQRRVVVVPSVRNCCVCQDGTEPIDSSASWPGAGPVLPLDGGRHRPRGVAAAGLHPPGTRGHHTRPWRRRFPPRADPRTAPAGPTGTLRYCGRGFTQPSWTPSVPWRPATGKVQRPPGGVGKVVARCVSLVRLQRRTLPPETMPRWVSASERGPPGARGRGPRRPRRHRAAGRAGDSRGGDTDRWPTR